ncbi:hypothetical protein Tco_0709756 [Tanacetum coccineum]
MDGSSSPDITPKEEPVTLDRPKSPNLFLHATQGTMGRLGKKGTLKKSCLPPRWRLLMGQIIQCLGGKTGGLDQISNKDATILYCLANGVQVDYAKIIWEDLIHKLDKKTREKIVPQGKNLGARSRLKRKQSSKHTSQSTTEASKSQSSHSKKETKSSSAMDTSPSHHSPPILVVGEMHKEAQQVAGGPTSLRDTSEDGAHPQLSIKLEDLSDNLKDTRSAFFTPDSPTDEPIIVTDKSEEEENAKNDKDTEDTLVPPPSPKSA